MDLAARFPADSAHKRECYIFKILGQIYKNLGCFEILEHRIGGAAGKPPWPHTKIGAGTPPYDAKKLLAPDAVWKKRVEMLLVAIFCVTGKIIVTNHG
jgi:hypothetical protein